jgi:Uma2 family endonuclease
MVQATRQPVTYAEYLARERGAIEKHEFVRGEVFAMAGGTFNHGVLTVNVSTLLANALVDRPCVVGSPDNRVRIAAEEIGCYPDVSVVCGKPEMAADDPDAVTNPVVLVEVLSPSTEAWDRGDKFAAYKTLTSLADYVLVSQKHRRIDHFRRNEDGTWLHDSAGPGGAVELSIGVRLATDSVYHKVELG